MQIMVKEDGGNLSPGVDLARIINPTQQNHFGVNNYFLIGKKSTLFIHLQRKKYEKIYPSHIKWQLLH